MKNMERIKIILITVGVTLGIEAIGAAVLFGSGAAHISAGSAAAFHQEDGLNETDIDAAKNAGISDATTASATETTASTTATTTTTAGKTNKVTKGNGGNTNKTTAAGKTTKSTSQATTAPTTPPTTKNVDNDGEWVDGWF